MSARLNREIESLKKSLLTLSAMVEESVDLAVRALVERDANLADRLIESDARIDRMEVDIEEECLKVLALHQPVAGDLRLIITILKVNAVLERIGDTAVNIARRASYLAGHPPLDAPVDLAAMAEKSKLMLRRSLDALVSGDTRLAKLVCRSDDEVDELKRHTAQVLYEHMERSPQYLKAYIQLLSVIRHFERIADHATSIAEDVIYLVEGEIVRHHVEDSLHPQ